MPVAKKPSATDNATEQKRRRSASDTRSDILAAAVRLFSEHSYEEIGLREIVADVGVDAALVKRYFGSKEGLFREVLEVANGARPTRTFFSADRSELAERLTRFVLDIDSDDEHRQANLVALMLTLRATHSQRTQPILRENMEERALAPLADWLGGEHATERAALMTAYLTGLATLQRLVKLEVFQRGDLDVIVEYVKMALQTCIDGQLPRRQD
jgi:AcrR family transcriptional regulator